MPREKQLVLLMRDVKDPKLSLIPLTVDHYTSDAGHQTFDGDKMDHANHGRNNEDQKNFELRLLRMIRQTIRRKV